MNEGGDRKELSALRVGRVARRETVGLFGRHEEAGVVHAERFENSFFEELLERLAADLSNEIADHIGGDRIIPGFSRGELQRNLCKVFDHRLQRSRFYDFADFHLAVGGIHVRTLLEGVGQARCVPQQVDDLHWPRWRFGQKCRGDTRLKHAEIFPFRNVFMDRFVERDPAFLQEHHEGNGGQGLGHRIDAKDRVVLHRRLALDVGEALYGAVNHLAAAKHQHLGSRKAAGIDVFLPEMRVDAIEPGFGHAGGFRRGGGRG
jgi:hypothetical protein